MKPITYIKFLIRNYIYHLIVNTALLLYLIVYTYQGGLGGIVGVSMMSVSTAVIIIGSRMSYIKYVSNVYKENQKNKIKWTKQ